MKKIIFILSCFCLPILAVAQTRADYEDAIQLVMKFYNARQADSLCRLLERGKEPTNFCIWDVEGVNNTHNNFGKISSFRYLFKDTLRQKGVTLIKVNATRRTFIIGCILDKEKRFEKFEWNMGSSYRDSLVFLK